MSERETAQAISDRAAAWVARMDRGGHDPAVRAELKAWLAGDDRRRGAHFRAKAARNMLGRATVLGAGHAQPYEVAAGGGSWVSRRRRLVGGGRAAAARGGCSPRTEDRPGGRGGGAGGEGQWG